MKLMMPGQPYTANSVPASPVGAVQRSARHGEQPNCNRAEPMPELASKSRWCDQSIHDAGHSDVASGRLEGRFTVWNSHRRKPSWPAFVCERINRPDIWTRAI